MSKKLLAFVMVVGVSVVMALFGITWSIQTDDKPSPAPANEKAIVISDTAPFQGLREPQVTFLHGKHVAALPEEGCAACHPSDEKDKGRYNFVYPKDRDERSQRALLNSYHENCYGCHTKRLEEKKEAGPIACGECHLPEKPEAWVKPVVFHYGIHNKHVQATEKKCELCHHTYNDQEKKLEYKEGTESSCRDCHRNQNEENRRAFRKVAHADCLNCHLRKQKEAKEAGPTACEKCHLELKVPTVKELTEVPRPDRKQPKTTLIKAEGAGTKEVFFDHQNHEMNTTTCRTCHHETMGSCKTCHTLQGSPEGKGVTLEEAYHKKTSALSCTGCHTEKQAEQNCAGCHLSMKTDAMNKNVCIVCHIGPVQETPQGPMLSSPENLISDNAKAEVVIDTLQKEYEPSKFPHLNIVKKLTDASNNNKLSRRFHREETTLCQGCHHAGAVEPKSMVPKCGSCHKLSFDRQDLTKPRLLAVYHLQCFGCHEKMNLKQGCGDCHQEKVKTVAGAQLQESASR